MTNFLLTVIIFLLLCMMFGFGNVVGTIIGLMVLIVVVWAFAKAVGHIWKCIK